MSLPLRLLPGAVPLEVVRGEPFAVVASFVDAAGAALPLTGTYAAVLLGRDLSVLAGGTMTVDATAAASGVLTISATAAASAVLVDSLHRWRLVDTSSTHTLLDGPVRPRPSGAAGVPVGSHQVTATVTVDAAEVTVTVLTTGSAGGGGGGADLSDDTPAALGTAAAGVGTEASRSDHVHAMPSAVDVGALSSTSGYNTANGWLKLDGSGTAPDNTLPASIARDTEVTAALAGKVDADSLPIITADVAIHVRDTGGAWPLTETSPVVDFAAWETAGGPAWWGINDGDVVAVNDTITPTRYGIYVYEAGGGFTRHSDYLTVGTLRGRVVSSWCKYSHLNPDPAAAPAGGIPLLGSAEPTAVAGDGDAVGSVGWLPQFWVDSWTFNATNAIVAAGGRRVLTVGAIADPGAAIPAMDGTQDPIHTTVGDFGTGGDFPIEVLGNTTILIPHPDHDDGGADVWRIPAGPTAWTLEASRGTVGAIGRLLEIGDLAVCTSSDVVSGVFIADIWVFCPTADFSTVEWRRLAPIDAAAATPSMRTLGTGATQAAAGNDARLSDARTPTAHAASHGDGGSDEVTVAESQVTGLVADLAARRPISTLLADGRQSDPARYLGTALSGVRSGSGSSIPADRLALGVWPVHAGTLTSLAVNVTTALAAGEKVDVCCWAVGADGLPTTLQWSQEVTVGTTTGDIVVASISKVIPTSGLWAIGVYNRAGNSGSVVLTGADSSSLASTATANGSPSGWMARPGLGAIPTDLSAYQVQSSSAIGMYLYAAFPPLVLGRGTA